MQRYTYIDKRTGERIYSEDELDEECFELVVKVRGSIPRGMEKIKEDITK